MAFARDERGHAEECQARAGRASNERCRIGTRTDHADALVLDVVGGQIAPGSGLVTITRAARASNRRSSAAKARLRLAQARLQGERMMDQSDPRPGQPIGAIGKGRQRETVDHRQGAGDGCRVTCAAASRAFASACGKRPTSSCTWMPQPSARRPSTMRRS